MFQKLTVVFCLFFTLAAFAQKGKTPSAAGIRIPLTADKWIAPDSAFTFLEYKGVPALKLLNPRITAVLKDFDFSDGTIEYDVEPAERRFASFYFRYNGPATSECFYFRTARAGQPQAVDGVQYTPYIKGVNMWDMLPQFQTGAHYQLGQWNHVKLVIHGRQMRVYINQQLALQVPHLECDSLHGTLAVDGVATYANFIVYPGRTEDLPPAPGIDPTATDTRYLRKWLVSKPADIPKDIDFSTTLMPAKDAAWDTVRAERQGLVNLSRLYGESKQRRIAWLQTTLHADSAQTRSMDFGFSDEVWVFINGKYLYVDKNYYFTPIAKEPDGRCSLENSRIKIPLQKGDNTLLIGVGNSFYGWGVIARLDALSGVELEE